MKRKTRTYENRYKHKLNMLVPGQIMAVIILCSALLGLLFFLFQAKILWKVFVGIAIVLLILLFILILVERHQDNVLYKLAKSQDPNIK